MVSSSSNEGARVVTIQRHALLILSINAVVGSSERFFMLIAQSKLELADHAHVHVRNGWQ